MTWLIFPPQSTTTSYDTLSLFESHSRFCDPSSHFSFYFSLLALFPLCVSSLPPPTPHPVHQSGEVIAASECIELFGNRTEERAHGAVMILMRRGGSRLTSPAGGLQTFIISTLVGGGEGGREGDTAGEPEDKVKEEIKEMEDKKTQIKQEVYCRVQPWLFAASCLSQ